MSVRTIASEERSIGDAMFHLSTCYSKGRGYYCFANPCEPSPIEGMIIHRITEAVHSTLQKADRYNAKHGLLLAEEEAPAIYRQLLAQLLLKDGTPVGFTSEHVWRMFQDFLAGHPEPERFEVDQFDSQAQKEYWACEFMYQAVLDGVMPAPADSAWMSGATYGRAFVEAMADAKVKLFDWGRADALKHKGDAAALVAAFDNVAEGNSDWPQWEDKIIKLFMATTAPAAAIAGGWA